METPDQKLEKAEVALRELNELYEFAETLYPIDRTMGPRQVSYHFIAHKANKTQFDNFDYS